MQTKMQ